MSPTPLKELRDGVPVDSEVYLLAGIELRTKKNGDPFLHLKLSDKSGSVDAKKWDTHEDEFRLLQDAAFVRIRGRAKEYNGTVELHLDDARAVAAGNLDPADFLPCTPVDRGELRAALDACLRDSMQDPTLRSLVEAVLAHPRVAPALGTAPAAVEFHHAYVGGLLEHMVSLSRLAYQVGRLYPELDRDLLLAGALLHDIGKVEELGIERGFQYTDRGKLKGHIALGAEIVTDAARSVPGLTADRLDQVLHLVLSHHGTREWGSPVIPATPEALALHHMDNLDAKLAGARAALNAAGGQSSRWTGYLRMFGGALFRGERGER